MNWDNLTDTKPWYVARVRREYILLQRMPHESMYCAGPYTKWGDAMEKRNELSDARFNRRLLAFGIAACTAITVVGVVL